MKTKLLLLPFLSAFKLTTFAQNKVVKYCEIIAYNNETFSHMKSQIMISTGFVDSLFSPKNVDIKAQLQKVNTLKCGSDVLNYMTSIGWSLVSITNNFFYFKKEFDPSELNSTKTQ